MHTIYKKKHKTMQNTYCNISMKQILISPLFTNCPRSMLKYILFNVNQRQTRTGMLRMLIV